MLDRFKFIDIFGKSMTFENDSTRKFHTIAGGASSMLLAIICIILTLFLGRDFYRHKIQSMTISEEINESTSIYLDNLPMLMAFFSNGFDINDPFEVVSLNMRKMTLKGSVSFEYLEKFQLCTSSKYKNYQSEVEELVKNSSFKLICYNSDSSEYIKNSLGDNDSITYFIEVTKCDSKIRKCHPNLENILKGFYTVIYFVNGYLNPNDFNTPLISYIESLNQFLIKGFTKSHFIKTAQFSFSSDNGWLLENIMTSSYLSVFSLTSDINTSIISRYNNREILYSLAVQTTKVTKHTVRRYMKITDVFAKIGGFMTVLFYVFKAIISSYSSFKYTFLIKNMFFDFATIDSSVKIAPLTQPQGPFIKIIHGAPQIHVQNNATVYDGANQNSIQVITGLKSNENDESPSLNFIKYITSSIICCINKKSIRKYNRDKAEVHRALSIKSYIMLLRHHNTSEYFKKDDDSII